MTKTVGNDLWTFLSSNAAEVHLSACIANIKLIYSCSRSFPFRQSVHRQRVFTLELCRERLLVLLVLQRHRLGPPELFMHLIGHEPPVHHPADHGDQQQALEDPSLPAGAHPVSHVGPTALPTVGARKPVETSYSTFRTPPLTSRPLQLTKGHTAFTCKQSLRRALFFLTESISTSKEPLKSFRFTSKKNKK